MDYLKDRINVQPLILSQGKYSPKELKRFIESKKIWEIRDIYKSQLIELFKVKYPSLQSNPRKNLIEFKNFFKLRTTKSSMGDWIYYPWSGLLVHSVCQSEYFELRTNRNKNLITGEEQEALYNSCVGIVGLSAGSGIAEGLVRQGIAKYLKLAEFDSLETTNMNRVRSNLNDIGAAKIDIIKKQIYEIDPYSKIHAASNGLGERNIRSFINVKRLPNVIFEMIDDFRMKVLLRKEARAHRVPVVMFSNIDEQIVIDIERYDIDANLEIFNNFNPSAIKSILYDPLAVNKHAVNLVGKEFVSDRALKSVEEIGVSLIGRPQLYYTVTISHGLAVYIAKKIILNSPLQSGRYLFRLSDISRIEQ